MSTPNPRTRTHHRPCSAPGIVRWAVIGALCVVAAGRGARASPDSSPPPAKRYTIRGEVVRLPDRAGGELTLRHEAVDDFTDMSGQIVGMSSMTMPFPVARGALPDGLRVGDKVEAVLMIDWGRGSQVLEHITKLPGETVLRYRKARPASSPKSGS